MRKLHEIIKDRWQAEKRHHNLFFDIVSADKLYSSARNDILDLLDAIANQEARLTAAETLLAECQAQAAALARADSLTAADLRTLARCAETTATMLDGPNDGTTGLMELAEKVRAMAARSAADDQ